MIHLLFNTFDHTLEINSNELGGTEKFERVTTIKTHEEGYYEVLQRQEVTDKNAPLFRFPIGVTVIQYVHE